MYWYFLTCYSKIFIFFLQIFISKIFSTNFNRYLVITKDREIHFDLIDFLQAFKRLYSVIILNFVINCQFGYWYENDATNDHLSFEDYFISLELWYSLFKMDPNFKQDLISLFISFSFLIYWESSGF